jgi:hypothetical protein
MSELLRTLATRTQQFILEMLWKEPELMFNIMYIQF